MINNYSKKYERTFNSDTDRIVRDHNMSGELLLPGAVFIDFALAGMDDIQELMLGKVYIYSPLLFKPGESKTLSLSREMKGETIKYNISSHQGEAGEVKHSEGSIKDSQSSMLGKLNLDSIKYRCLRKLGSEGYYKLFSDAGLGYGDFYRNIEMIRFNDDEVLAKIVLQKEASCSGRYNMIHPAVMDCVFQSVGIFSFANNSPYIHVPFYIENMIFKRMPNINYYCYGRIRDDNNDASTVLKYDLSICDENGCIYMDISNFYLKRIKK